MSLAADSWAEQLTSCIEVGRFRRSLIQWGRLYGRSYPWRQTQDPYRVLVSEILLHRTRADQVLPLYENLVVRYPSASALASASETELQTLLYSGGLRWRVGLMRNMAAEVVERHGGIVPQTSAELLSLPGVGQYIASAVLCCASPSDGQHPSWTPIPLGLLGECSDSL